MTGVDQMSQAAPIQQPSPEVRFETQPGFQRRFVGSKADITIGGGAANCGKRLWVGTPIATPSGWTTMGELRT